MIINGRAQKMGHGTRRGGRWDVGTDLLRDASLKPEDKQPANQSACSCHPEVKVELQRATNNGLGFMAYHAQQSYQN